MKEQAEMKIKAYELLIVSLYIVTILNTLLMKIQFHIFQHEKIPDPFWLFFSRYVFHFQYPDHYSGLQNKPVPGNPGQRNTSKAKLIIFYFYRDKSL